MELLCADDMVQDPGLQAATTAELKRKQKSSDGRVRKIEKNRAATTANGITDQELQRARIFGDLAAMTLLPDDVVVRREGLVLQQPYTATVFVANNPWLPTDPVITFVAVLRGCWVITPNTYRGSSATALKYRSALLTSRMVWVSDSVRNSHGSLWLAMLEVLSKDNNAKKWKLLHSAHQYATEKAHLRNLFYD